MDFNYYNCITILWSLNINILQLIMIFNVMEKCIIYILCFLDCTINHTIRYTCETRIIRIIQYFTFVILYCSKN